MSVAATSDRRTGNPVALQHDLLAMAFSAGPARPTYAARG